MIELDGPYTVGYIFLQKISFYVMTVTRELEVLRQRLRARKLCISSIKELMSAPVECYTGKYKRKFWNFHYSCFSLERGVIHRSIGVTLKRCLEGIRLIDVFSVTVIHR